MPQPLENKISPVKSPDEICPDFVDIGQPEKFDGVCKLAVHRIFDCRLDFTGAQDPEFLFRPANKAMQREGDAFCTPAAAVGPTVTGRAVEDFLELRRDSYLDFFVNRPLLHPVISA